MVEGDICRCSEELSKLLESISLTIWSLGRELQTSAKADLSEVSKRLRDFENCLGTKLGFEKVLKSVEENIDQKRWYPAMAGLYALLSELPPNVCKKKPLIPSERAEILKRELGLSK
jgi:hypothetical protein